MLAIFEIIGGFVRFLLINAFFKIFGRREPRKLKYFMNDKKGQNLSNLANDYSNGIIGFISFGVILYLVYLLFG